jgi:ribose transport system substrate-binding protein
MRYDYLRLEPLLEGGLGRPLKQGAVFTNWAGRHRAESRGAARPRLPDAGRAPAALRGLGAATLKRLGVLLALSVLATGCQRAPSPATTRGPRIALVMKTPNNPFFIDMQKGADAAAARLGVELVVQSPEREIDVEKQMQIVENLIETGVEALCIAPAASKGIIPALAKANAAKIPIVVVDDQVDAKAAAEAGVHTESYVGSDNVEGGRLAGRRLIDATNGRASVAVLEGIPGHETGDSRLSGFKQAIQAAPGVKLVVSQTANWERDQGYSVFQNMLQAHPEIDAVFACNDMMALGAAEAIAAAGKTGKIRVIGFDAVDDARKAILAGQLDASIAQYPSEMGRLAVETALRLVRGEKVAADQRTRIGLVTKETLDH